MAPWELGHNDEGEQEKRKAEGQTSTVEDFTTAVISLFYGNFPEHHYTFKALTESFLRRRIRPSFL